MDRTFRDLNLTLNLKLYAILWSLICCIFFMKKKKTELNQPGPGGDTLPVNPPPRKQLLPEEADEYLRESSNIEDLPSPEQEDEEGKLIKTDQPKK